MRKVRTLLLVMAIVGFTSCADDANEIFDQSKTEINLNNGGNGSGEDADDPIPPGCGC